MTPGRIGELEEIKRDLIFPFRLRLASDGRSALLIGPDPTTVAIIDRRVKRLAKWPVLWLEHFASLLIAPRAMTETPRNLRRSDGR